MINLEAGDSAIDLDNDMHIENEEPKRENLSILDISSQIHNDSIVIMLNNESTTNKSMHERVGDLTRDINAGSNKALSGGAEISCETIIPSFNQDPPITIEEALTVVQGEPDNYAIRTLYLVSNLLSMTGFMLFLSLPFMF